jgi:hypothetical protein
VIAAATQGPRPRRLGRSVAAYLGAFLAVAALSLATDQLLHSLGVYPPWNQPMHDPGLNLLALAYRIVYGVLGGYLVARLAPSEPMRHAVVLGVVGLILSSIGAVVATQHEMGPLWYPIALALTALPASWLGGALYLRQLRQPRAGGR